MFTFGERLKQFRVRAGLEQHELANDIGVHRNTISKWENNYFLPDSPERVLDLAKALTLDEAETDSMLIAANYPPKYGRRVPNNQLPFTGYASRIHNFLGEYLGLPGHSIPFGGRNRELQFLNNWLSSQSASPYLLITAPAGRGKSALLVHWHQMLLERQNVAVVYFPISVRYNTCLSSVIFSSLVPQLAYLHNENIPFGPDMSEEFWRGFLSDYLARSLPNKRTLVIILDGIDEAVGWDIEADLFPTSPPSNLRVVLSARSLVNDPEGTMWLDQLGWTHKGLAEKITLLPLDRAGIAEVINQVASSSTKLGSDASVITWLYQASEGDPLILQFLLKDLSERNSENLPKIQPGLEGIFRRWWDGQKKIWGQEADEREKTVQILLSLLACSHGPLGKSDLEELAEECGLDTTYLRQSLESLKRFIIGDGEQQGYVFSHPRLRSYFYGRLSKSEQQHTERIFLRWGQRIISALGAGHIHPKDVSPFLVQYYGIYLEHSESPPEALLKLVSGLWSQAWEALEGNFTGFLRDVDRAWQIIEQFDQQSTTVNKHAPFLAEEVRCALCHVSVNSLAYNIPPNLATILVQEGIWSISQGLAYAQQSPEIYQRFALLEMLAPLLPSQLIDTALHTARNLPEQGQFENSIRATVTAILAAGLPLDEQLPILRRELDTIRALPEKGLIDNSPRGEALVKVVPHLPPELRDIALDTALSLQDPRARAEALTGIITYIPDTKRPSVVSAAFQAACLIEIEGMRAEALAALVPHLPNQLIEEVIKVSNAFDFDGTKATVQIAVAKCLPKDQQYSIVRDVLENACHIEGNWEKGTTLAALAPLLQGELIDIALQCADTIEYARSRAGAFIALVQVLPQAKRAPIIDTALNSIFASSPEWPLADMLSALAPYLASKKLIQALRAVYELDNVQDQIQCLAILAKQLPLYKRLATLQKVLDIIKTMPEHNETFQMLGNNDPKANALVSLVPYLPREALIDALNTARTIPDEPTRAQALGTFFKQLSPAKQTNILTEVFDTALSFRDERGQVKALETLAPSLSAKLLNVTLEVIQDFRYRTTKREALEIIARYLPLKLLDSFLEMLYSLDDEKDQVQILLALAPRLSPEQLTAILNVIFVPYRNWALSNEYPGATPLYVALIMLMRVLSPSARISVARFALNVAQEVNNEEVKADLLEVVGFASHLPSQLLLTALNIAQSLQQQKARLDALVALVKHLPVKERSPILQQIVNSVHSLSDVESQVKILVSVLKILPQDQQSPIAQLAIDKALEVTKQSHNWLILESVIPFLNSITAKNVLHALNTLENQPAKAQILTKLVKQVSSEDQSLIIHLALDTIYSVQDSNSQMQLLNELATEVPLEMQSFLADVALSNIYGIKSERGQAEVLKILSSYIPLELVETFQGIVSKFQQENNRAIALTAILRHIPEEEFFPVMSSARDMLLAIKDKSIRAEALIALIHQLDVKSLQMLINIAQTSRSENLQIKVLAALADLAPEFSYQLWSKVLHKLAKQKRSDLLANLIKLVPTIIKLGDEGAVVETTQAIIDVSRWWP